MTYLHSWSKREHHDLERDHRTPDARSSPLQTQANLQPSWHRELDAQDELALGIADEVDRSHVDGELLLLGDEVDRQLVGTKSSLDSLDTEFLVESTGIRLESDTEEVDVLLLSSIDDLSPGVLSAHLGNTSPVNDAARLALESLVSWLIAKLAELRVGGAVSHGVTLFTAGVTGASEGAVNLGVGAVGLVVPDLSTVEALSGQATALRLVRAFASEVSGLLAAGICQ
jgi:hypothetical protein